MADPHNVEFEAAKFLQKLIHESTDEPAKLATKLYVILQHMKASGKENSMPYQVISRAMETVINQHGLDIEALMSSRVPLSNGSHVGESARAQSAGCSQSLGVATDSKSGIIENDTTRPDGFGSGRPPAAPSNIGNDPFQGSVSQRSAMSFDQESPSSMDTRSTNSYSQDRREPPGREQQGFQKDPKRAIIKRKRNDSSGLEIQDDTTQQLDSNSVMPDKRKEGLTSKSEAGGSVPVDSGSWKQGFLMGATSFRERAVPGTSSSVSQVDIATRNLNPSTLDADRLSQGGNHSNLYEVGIPGSLLSRDTGKQPAIPASVPSMPFKEHHLKQLRAQCLVFLAFRNNLSPKRLHLEIALGNILPKEGTSSSVDGAQNDLIEDKGKQQMNYESSSISEVPLPQGNLSQLKSDGGPTVSAAAVNARDADLISKEADNRKLVVGKPSSLAGPSHTDEETKQLSSGNGILEADTESQEVIYSSAFVTVSLQPDTSGMRSPAIRNNEEILMSGGESHAASVVGGNQQLKPEMVRWTRINQNDFSRRPLPASVLHDLGSGNESSSILSQRDSSIQNQQLADSQLPTPWKSMQGMDNAHLRARPVNDVNMLLRNPLHDGNGALEIQMRSIADGLKVVPVSDSSYIPKDSSSLAPTNKSLEPEEEENPLSDKLPSSPKYTLSEKWIMAHQKKKLATEQKWVQKLQKADQRIATCFNELKETVSSSADISAKTRSVIKLKKLQLLELQRCLRRNILSDFFKPIQTEMDRLKSIKKHRIGRRLKHVEKYEQKMKEERQKRIRERQKEFFSEVEVHKDRLEDVFKCKRERCKGFNRYIKEFHKRKERIHREKIDRIQREKINLLKINDVEGYLRMVQDAKSDRVKQLLKETEKYLLKLGSKLKEAKAAARQVEMDENRIAAVDESSDIFTETEDENDQAKHYKESNEKYYLIAHSIKESIAEQPTGLRGGKLREYQMNGLRWLVSLYNNHLNGILADEMGLGKTVQVISLICYLMETKNDRGPFLVVVPSSVLPGWEHELNFWAPGINKIVYAGPPEERRRLFKESITHQKFNVLLTTYEYLMNKHDRPKLSKIHWHYVIIDEGHRIKNASCKLNADLKHYNSSHRLLLTGTPLQNNLEELWALLNFLLPNIFNSSEDFSQWFNKPFESNGDNVQDEALLSEEENLLIINRLHQVLRPFVLRRLKHKVENELPEKIERLVRCEASAYQKLLMKRVEDNLGALGVSKARAVHNSVMELRNICNHPYLSQLHAEEVDTFIPKHFLPPIIRLCGKLEMLDRLLPKLKATNHRVLFFSTMTRLLDVMEEYLGWKQYRYLRLDGHTSGLDRGALIEKFNQPDSPFFIFLLSIRAGGVGVNLQAADTVIIFDTDWNPQVDLQAQARAHRIGQKKDVLVLRLETVNTVEEQVRAAAEHKLGVANQSITAGFFDNNTSAEDRREYLESLLRESKKEEAAPVLDDDSLNDILARSESEIDVFEAVDQKRREEEMATWKRVVLEKAGVCSEATPSLPSRLVTDDDLKAFYEAMKIYDLPTEGAASSSGMKRKSGSLGCFDTQQYGRGKRAREVRSYEEQWTEEEFEKMCKAESSETAKSKDEKNAISLASDTGETTIKVEPSLQTLQIPPPSLESSPVVKKEVTPPVKRGRGRPRRTPVDVSPVLGVSSTPNEDRKPETQMQKETDSSMGNITAVDTHVISVVSKDTSGDHHQVDALLCHNSKDPGVQSNISYTSVATQPKRQGRKGQASEKNIDGNSAAETVRRRGRKPNRLLSTVTVSSPVQDSRSNEQPPKQLPSDGMGGSGRRRSEGGADLAAEDLKTSEPETKQNSSEISLMTVAPNIGTEINKLSALSNSQNSSVEGSAFVSADAAVPDPKSIDQPIKVAVFDSTTVALAPSETSTVGAGNYMSQDQVLSVSESLSGSVAAAMVGSLASSKSGTGPNNDTPQAAHPSSDPVLPSGIGPGRRQSQKLQSGIEPVRRRGRKRRRIVSTDPAVLDVQSENLNELLNSAVSLSTSAATYVAAPTGPADMGSHVATVPVIPLVPVSGYVIGSTPLTSTSGSAHHVNFGFASSIPASSQPSPVLSGTPDTVPMQVQAGEIAPRRRGRKKSATSPADSSGGHFLSSRHPDRSAGDFIDRKVIATRSRQLNISEAKKSQEEAHACDTAVALTSHVVIPSVSESASIKPDGAIKPQESRLANAKDEITLCRSPAEIPPISCKGKTNVIVLALETTAPSVDPMGISCKDVDVKEWSELQKDSARNALVPKAEISRLDAKSAADTQAPNPDEELSAPPGFDTPRPGVSDATGRKSLKTDDSGMSKICDTENGSVVLALESTARTVDPCSIPCENMSEKENSSELHKIKDLGKGSISSSKTISCKPVESLDGGTCQQEEEMSAPPGFDIPQHCLSNIEEFSRGPRDDNAEYDAVNAPTVFNALISDIAPVSNSEPCLREVEHSNGPDEHGKVDVADAHKASHSVGPDIVMGSILKSNVEKESHGPDDGYVGNGVSDPDSDAAAILTLESRNKEEVHGPGDDTGELEAGDATAASCTIGSDMAAISTLGSKEKEECHDVLVGPHDTVELVAGDAPTASNVGDHTQVVISVGSLEKEECCGLENVDVEHDVADVLGSDTISTSLLVSTEIRGNIPTPSDVGVCDTAAVSTLKLKDKEECYGLRGKDKCHGPNDGIAANDPLNGPVAMCALSSDNAVTSILASRDTEECHEPSNGDCEFDATALTTLHVGLNSVSFSDMKLKEKEECHDPNNGNSEYDVVNGPTISHVALNSAASSDLESKEKEEHCEPGNANSEHDAATAPTLDMGSDSAASSEPGNCNSEHDVVNAPTILHVGLNSAHSSDLKSKEKEENCEAGNGKSEHDAAILPTILHVGSNIAASSDREAKEKEEHHDPENGKSEHDAAMAPATLHVGSNTLAFSDMESKDKEECHEPGNGSSDNDVANDSIHHEGLNSVACSDVINVESKQKDERCVPEKVNTEHDAAITPATLDVGLNSAVSSEMGSKEKHEYHEPSNGNSDNAAVNDPTLHEDLNSAASSDLQLKREEEHCELHDGDSEHDVVRSPTRLHVDTNIASSSDMKSNEKEECHEPENGNSEHDAAIAPTTLLAGSNCAPSSDLESIEKDVCPGNEPSSGNSDDGANDQTTLHDGLDCLASSNLEEKQKEVCFEPANGNSGHDVVNAPTTLHMGLNCAPSSDIDSKEREECHEAGNGISECVVVNAPTTLDVGLNNAPSSDVEFKGREECQEPSNDNSEHDFINAPTTLQSSNSAPSSDMESKDREECHEPSNLNSDSDVVNVPTTLGVGLNSALSSDVESKARAECHEPSNDNSEHDVGNAPTTLHVGSNSAPSSDMESKEREECHEPSNGNSECDVVSAPTRLVGLNSAPSSDVEFKGREECHEPSNDNSERDAVNAPTTLLVGSNSVPSSDVESKERKELHEPWDCNAERDASNTPAIVHVDLKSMTSSDMESKDREECREPGDGNCDNDAVNDLTTLRKDSSSAAYSDLESKDSVCHVPGIGNLEHDAASAPTIVCVGFKSVTSSDLEIKEKECHGFDTALTSSLETKEKDGHEHSDGSAELDVGDSPTASCIEGSDAAAALISELNGKEKCQGTQNSTVEQDVVDATPIDNPAGSTLESLEKTVCHHGPDCGDAEYEAGDSYSTLHVVGSDIEATLNSGSKETEEYHGSDVGNDEFDAADLPMGLETVAASSLVYNKDCNGPDNGNAEHDAGDAFKGSDIRVASNLVAIDKECHGPDVGDVEQDAGNALATSCVVGTDNAAASTLEQKDQEP